jgi:hypothetical protein
VLGQRHVLVVVGYPSDFAVWLPTGRRWSVASESAWPALSAGAKEAIHAYLAEHPHGISLGDALAAVASATERLGSGPPNVGFPWLGFASEDDTRRSGKLGNAWAGTNGGSAAMAQEPGAVQITFEGSGAPETKRAASPDELASLAPWFEAQLRSRAEAFAESEARRLAAVEKELGQTVREATLAVIAAIRQGRRFEVHGSRGAYRTYFLEGDQVRCEDFEEGNTMTYSVGVAEMEKIVEHCPEAFRHR